MTGSYSIKGSVVQSKIDAFEALNGRDAALSLKQRLAGKLPRLLNALEWYPYELLVEVLDDMRAHGFAGQLEGLSKIGVETAKILLSSTYRPLTNVGDWLTFMSTAARLHGLYYSVGQMNVGFEEGMCLVDFDGAPHYDPGDLHVAGGFYTGSANHFGVEASYTVEVDAQGGHVKVKHT